MPEIILSQIAVKDLEEIIENCIRKAIASNHQSSSDSNEDAPDLINIDDAVKLLNLARPTIYSLVSNSKIPYMKKTKKLYFSRNELTDWIKSGRQKTKSEKVNEGTMSLKPRKESKK